MLRKIFWHGGFVAVAWRKCCGYRGKITVIAEICWSVYGNLTELLRLLRDSCGPMRKYCGNDGKNVVLPMDHCGKNVDVLKLLKSYYGIVTVSHGTLRKYCGTPKFVQVQQRKLCGCSQTSQPKISEVHCGNIAEHQNVAVILMPIPECFAPLI